jgi:hypothetical protein
MEISKFHKLIDEELSIIILKTKPLNLKSELIHTVISIRKLKQAN